MSDSSEPQRLGVLESNVEEMKEELSHNRGELGELKSMMRQLLRANPAGGGPQVEEESGGTGRGAANNDSSGAERASQEGAAGNASFGTTAAAAGGRAGERGFTYSNRVLGGPRPGDLGRMPAVPAGVGPATVMDGGEARDSYPAGIAANDVGGVFPGYTGYRGQPTRVIPPLLKAEKGSFQRFKHDFLPKTNMINISHHFVGEDRLAVPVRW